MPRLPEGDKPKRVRKSRAKSKWSRFPSLEGKYAKRGVNDAPRERTPAERAESGKARKEADKQVQARRAALAELNARRAARDEPALPLGRIDYDGAILPEGIEVQAMIPRHVGETDRKGNPVKKQPVGGYWMRVGSAKRGERVACSTLDEAKGKLAAGHQAHTDVQDLREDERAAREVQRAERQRNPKAPPAFTRRAPSAVTKARQSAAHAEREVARYAAATEVAIEHTTDLPWLKAERARRKATLPPRHNRTNQNGNHAGNDLYMWADKEHTALRVVEADGYSRLLPAPKQVSSTASTV